MFGGALAKLALAIALAASLALAWALWDRARVRVVNERLQGEVRALTASLEQAEEARAVHRAHLDRMAEDERERETLLKRLREMEGLDAPLPDPMRNAGRVLWPD